MDLANFKFDEEKETLNEYLRRVEKIKMDLNKQKYNILLDLLNDLFSLTGETKFKSLTKIKNIPISGINDDHIKKIFKKYKKDIKKHHNYKIKKDNYNIINILSKLLGKMEYRLDTKIKLKKTYITIYVI